MITHWTRDRTRGERLPLEWVVKKQTHDTARLYGLGDRGTIEDGAVADLNLIDYDHLQMGNPTVVADLPGRRAAASSRTPTGYVETIKSGVTTFADGEDTGARPGTLAAGRPLTRGDPAQSRSGRASPSGRRGRRRSWPARPRRACRRPSTRPTPGLHLLV